MDLAFKEFHMRKDDENSAIGLSFCHWSFMHVFFQSHSQYPLVVPSFRPSASSAVCSSRLVQQGPLVKINFMLGRWKGEQQQWRGRRVVIYVLIVRVRWRWFAAWFSSSVQQHVVCLGGALVAAACGQRGVCVRACTDSHAARSCKYG